MTYYSFVKNGKKMTLGKYESRPIGLLIYRIKFRRRNWTSFVYRLARIQCQICNFPALQSFFHDKKFPCMIYYSRKRKSKINKDKKFQWYFTLTFYGLNRQRMHSFNGLFFIHVIECKKKDFFGILKTYFKTLKWLITETFSKPETNHFCY